MQDHPVEFESLLVETPHPDGPFGAKGMGEAALPPVAAAIGNAIAKRIERSSRERSADKPDKIVAMLNAGKEGS